MSEIVGHRRHGMELAAARELAGSMAERLRADFGGSYAWDGDTLRFRRTGASGHVTVRPDDIEIRVALSFLLSPLHGRIEREILAFCDERLGAPAAQRARPTAARTGSTRSSRSQGASRSARPK
jgi:putative polyhydroxyalkanoate system protein